MREIVPQTALEGAKLGCGRTHAHAHVPASDRGGRRGVQTRAVAVGVAALPGLQWRAGLRPALQALGLRMRTRARQACSRVRVAKINLVQTPCRLAWQTAPRSASNSTSRKRKGSRDIPGHGAQCATAAIRGVAVL